MRARRGRPDLGVRIRRMVEADLAGVLRIERASFSVPWTPATFLGLLHRDDAHLLVAETDEALVGYAAVWIVGDQAELGDLAVEAAWRRRGIGSVLVDAVLDMVERRGVRELFLEVRATNEGAQRLYTRYGFSEVGRRKDYYTLPREDALVLRRWVGESASVRPTVPK